ncbi:Uncharacterized protein FWK35_00026831, partial [Aphis craccivora]
KNQKPKNKIIIIDFEFSNYQLTDLILISAAISQTHVKSEIIRLRGRSLIISFDGRIRLMNNYSYIKARALLLKIFEKKPDQLQVILNELHLVTRNDGDTDSLATLFRATTLTTSLTGFSDVRRHFLLAVPYVLTSGLQQQLSLRSSSGPVS